MKRSLDGNRENQSKKGLVEMIRGGGSEEEKPFPRLSVGPSPSTRRRELLSRDRFN